LAWSAYSLRRTWNQVKEQAAPWWGENSKEAYSSGLSNLVIALGNWSASRTGSLSDRTYTRDQCGLMLDRDLDAARNLAALVGVVTGGDGGGLRRDSPMETHVRPALRGRRVPPREGPRVNARTVRNGLQDTTLRVS